MDDVPCSDRSADAQTYIGIKRAIMSGGLLACSQVGFNIMLGPLCRLYSALSERLRDLDPSAVHWMVPALLRADWVPEGAVPAPPREQWCREEPGGHLLTPRLLLHLLSRLRWHPEVQAGWLLTGQCVRNETDTLPLLRQRAFSVVEYAWRGDEEWAFARQTAALERLLQLCGEWGLPTALERAGDEQSLSVSFADSGPVKLAHASRLAPAVLGSYGLEPETMTVLGCGVERFVLAYVAAHGPDPAAWELTG